MQDPRFIQDTEATKVTTSRQLDEALQPELVLQGGPLLLPDPVDEPSGSTLSSNVVDQGAQISYPRYLLLRSLHGAIDMLFATLLNFAFIAVFLMLCSYLQCIPLFSVEILHTNGLVAYFIFVLTAPLWFLIAKCGSSSNGWTTRVIGLRVVDKNGHDLSNFRALLRTLAFALTWFLLPVHLGFVVFGNRRMLHDLCTGAYVVSNFKRKLKMQNERSKSDISSSLPLWFWMLSAVALLMVSGYYQTVCSVLYSAWGVIEGAVAMLLMILYLLIVSSAGAPHV